MGIEIWWDGTHTAEDTVHARKNKPEPILFLLPMMHLIGNSVFVFSPFLKPEGDNLIGT